jgi:hypothetical protein
MKFTGSFKTLIIVFLSLSVLFFLNSSAQTHKNPNTNELLYLKKLVGRYPSDVKFLTANKLSVRIKKLTSLRYEFLKSTWAVEEPIEMKGHILKAWGCQDHNCDQTNFIIVVDFENNVVYCGIRENGTVKEYSEDGSTNAEIIKWSKRN